MARASSRSGPPLKRPHDDRARGAEFEGKATHAEDVVAWKISLSALLILLAVSAVILRLTRLHGFLASDYYADAPSALHALYFALVLAMAPTVIAVGRGRARAGGRGACETTPPQ